MARPKTRSEFKSYCLRKLGSPVIQINVTDEQVEDRIDEALELFHEYHFNGSETLFLKHQVTQDDKDNKFIPINEDIMGVLNIFNVNTSAFSSGGMFNASYQFVLNNVQDFGNYDLTNYYMTKQNVAFIQDILVGVQPIRFNRHVDKLWIDTNWDRVKVGTFIVAEVQARVNGDAYPDVWSERWLQNYSTALIKRQWGSILSKYEGAQLIGGVTFSGVQIMTDADAEIKDLEDELYMNYTLPAKDMIG